jgi:hypothetical protein
MSLFALPVTVADLEQLQNGIEFFTNAAEATAEEALINAGTATVNSYALQLLANNISLSQVAMAEDSLMFGVTDSTTELTKLSTQFLPAQVANAIAHGYNPTVYAAEALGLALAGGNGTSNAFATNFGTLSVSQFSQSVATLTGVSVNAIQTWVTNWVNFYTAHPTATGGLSTTLAAYGAAFGDAVGTALLNPAGAALQAQVQNALFDNAQGTYVAGVALGALPAATPFQGDPATTFTLTVGQDTAITGQPFVGPPGTTGGVVPASQVTIEAPLSGIFGNQNTLTDFDTIQLAGKNNTLNVSIDGHTNINGVTIQGVQTWNLVDDGFGTVTINGGGTAASPSITGLTELNFNGNGGGGTLNLGTTLLPIDKPGDLANGFTLGVSNALGGIGHHIDIAFASGVLTGTEAITVNAFSVGNVDNNDLNDAYGIAAGGTGPGKKGFGTWNLNSTGATLGTVNDIALGGEDNNTATTLNITDDGSTTIVYASSASGSTAGDWSNLTTVNASGTTGQLTVTGGETVASINGFGLLSADTTALTTVIGGTGNDLFDLSSFSAPLSQLTVIGNSAAGNTTTVELNNTEVTSGVAPAVWHGVQTLLDVGNPDVGGTINMADFPGTTTLSFVDAHSGPNATQTANILIENGPPTFTVEFNNTNENGFNFQILGGGSGSTLTVDYNELTAGQNSTGAFASQGYDNTNINIASASGTVDFYSHGVTAVSTPADAEVLTINANGVGADILIGDTAAPVVGHSSLTLLGGSVLGVTTGTLDITGTAEVTIGVTNASTISDTGGVLIMDAPGNDIIYPGFTGISVTAAAAGSVLSGTVGPETPISTTLDPGAVTAFTAITGNDTLTDTAGGVKFWGDGGSDTLNMGGDGNIAFFGEILAGPSGLASFENQLVTNNLDQAYQGFWGVANGTGPSAISTTLPGMVSLDAGLSAGTEVDNTTINGFSFTATNQDALRFNVDAWAGGNTGIGSLVQGDGHTVVAGATSSMQLVTAPAAALLGGTNVVADSIDGTFANASTLAASLASANGDLVFAGTGVAAHTSVHMLVAYETAANTIEVADVDFINNTGAAVKNTDALSHIVVSDMVKLVGAGSLNDLVTHPGAVVFDHVA